MGTQVYVTTTNANGKTALNVNTRKYIELSPGLRIRYHHEQIRHIFSLTFFLQLPIDVRKADVVHIQSIFSTYTFWGLLWSFLWRRPVILSPHGSLGVWSMNQGSKWKKFFLQWLIKPLLNKAIFHATAPFESDEIKLFLPDSIVRVIPSGINLKEYEAPFNNNQLPGISSSINLLQNSTESHCRDNNFKTNNYLPPKKIISISRLHYKKGMDILIRSFVILRRKGHNLSLLIAGSDDGVLQDLKILVSENGLQDHVYFVGELLGDDKTTFFQGGDVFALPSHHENFGIVYLEALAAGIPVVASKNTPWQILESNGCGRCVKNTPEAFAEAIESQLDIKSEAFFIKSRTFAQEFEWKNIASQFIKLYADQKDRL